jgi:hypothetical protein
MSSPPGPSTPPQGPGNHARFTPTNRNLSGGDRDAPGAGRLADINESGLTRGGRAKTKLTMKPVTRTTKKEAIEPAQSAPVVNFEEVADSRPIHHREVEDGVEVLEEVLQTRLHCYL